MRATSAKYRSLRNLGLWRRNLCNLCSPDQQLKTPEETQTIGSVLCATMKTFPDGNFAIRRSAGTLEDRYNRYNNCHNSSRCSKRRKNSICQVGQEIGTALRVEMITTRAECNATSARALGQQAQEQCNRFRSDK